MQSKLICIYAFNFLSFYLMITHLMTYNIGSLIKFSFRMGSNLNSNNYDCPCCKSKVQEVEFRPLNLARNSSIHSEDDQKKLYLSAGPKWINHLHIKQIVDIDNLDLDLPILPYTLISNLRSNQARNSFISSKGDNKQEIYLSVDPKWVDNMRINQNFDIDILQAYQFVLNKGKVNVQRKNNDNQKIQILFQQNIPMYGVYYYELQVHSYTPYKGCLLTFGIVDHLAAYNLKHCKGTAFEQSYTFKIDKVIDESEEFKIKKLVSFTLKLEVNREQKTIQFYYPAIRKVRKQIDGLNKPEEHQYEIKQEQCLSQSIKQSLLSQSVSIVPFLQTQYTGIQFSWKVPSSINH